MISLISALATLTVTTYIDVNIVDVERGRVLMRQNLVVEGETIKALGARVKPEGEQVKASGQFVIPGLWDMHVHGTGTRGFPELFVANGVVGIRDMFSQMADIKRVRNGIAQGSIVGPDIVAAGRIVDGPKPIWPGSVAVSNGEEGRRAVETVVKEGSDFVKVYSLLSRESYFAIAEEAKRRKVVFAGHVPNSVTVQEASNAGQKSTEHLYGILRACSSREAEIDQHPEWTRLQRAEAINGSFDARKAKAVFATFKKNQTWQCPTMVVIRSLASLRDPVFTADKRADFIPAYYRTIWDPKNDFRFKAWTEDDWKAAKINFDRQVTLVAEMQRAGVPIIAGTDVGNPYVFPGFSLHDELALYVKGGMSAVDALRTATLNPAKFLNREKSEGSIKVGKRANLVFLTSNPLERIENTTAISSVVLRGVRLDQAALDRLKLAAVKKS